MFVAMPGADDRLMRISRDPEALDLAVPTDALAGWALVAALFPAWMVLRSLNLSVYFSPTDTALYAAKIGHLLLMPAVIAAVVLAGLATAIWRISPPPGTALTAGVAVAISMVLGLTGLAWEVADRALAPYGPEVRAVAEFVPPAGATYTFDVRRASERPEVVRHWDLPASSADACAGAVERFAAWADPGTVVKRFPSQPRSCSHDGRRGPHVVQLLMSDVARIATGDGTLLVTVRRA